MQEAHKTFKAHYNTISKWLNRYLEERHINPREAYRQPPYKLNWEELRDYVKENPDLTQAEYGEHFGVSQAQICRILKALDITYKKSLTYLEQDPEKVKELKELLENLPEGAPIVYLDESVIKQEPMREYGYAERGKEVFGKVSGKRTKKLNMIAALCDDEIIAPLIYTNNMDSKLFNLYLQIILLPLLAFGAVIVMDNARYHISKETRKLIEKMGCRLIYLPPDGVLFHPFTRFK